jgi:hypothetical protein
MLFFVLMQPSATVKNSRKPSGGSGQTTKRIDKVEGAAGSGIRGNTSKQEESIYMKNQGED